MNKRFSEKVKKVLANSREEALKLGHDYIGTEHILLGILSEKDNVAIQVLNSLKIDLSELKEQIIEAIPVRKGEETTFQVGNLPLNKQAEKVLKFTYLEAKSNHEDEIYPEHLMLSILKHQDNLACSILKDFNVDYELYRSELDYISSQDASAEDMPEISASANDPDSYEDEPASSSFSRKAGSKSQTPVLDNYGHCSRSCAQDHAEKSLQDPFQQKNCHARSGCPGSRHQIQRSV